MSAAELTEEPRLVEEDLARLRETTADLRRHIATAAASAATHNPQELTVKVIVYADFNCVYCYLASQRADRLVQDGKADIEWRAVEHRPRLPVTGVKSGPGGADRGGRHRRGHAVRAARRAAARDAPGHDH